MLNLILFSPTQPLVAELPKHRPKCLLISSYFLGAVTLRAPLSSLLQCNSVGPKRRFVNSQLRYDTETQMGGSRSQAIWLRTRRSLQWWGLMMMTRMIRPFSALSHVILPSLTRCWGIDIRQPARYSASDDYFEVNSSNLTSFNQLINALLYTSIYEVHMFSHPSINLTIPV